MKNTYENFEQNIYPTLGYGYIPDASKFHWDIFERGLVAEVPNPGWRGRKSRNTLRICEYRDFRFTETRLCGHGNAFTVTYIPTGEIILEDHIGLVTIEHFIWWWYNHK